MLPQVPPKTLLLRSAGRRCINLISPFYRRFPYSGEMDIFKLNPRGAFSPVEPFFYNRMPKAANTTITGLLHQASAFRPKTSRRRQNPKYQFLTPLTLTPQQVKSLEHKAFKFTFVRNPYTRTLSAYLDKVGRKRHQGRRFLTWAEKNNEPQSFLGFCRYLETCGLFDDMHWAPQTDILLLPQEQYNFIGKVESIREDLLHVLDTIFGSSNLERVPHLGNKTAASSHVLDAYGPEEEAIIRRLYANDFEQLGYDDRL